MKKENVVTSFLEINERDYFTKENYLRFALMMELSYTSSVKNFKDLDKDFSYDENTLNYCKELHEGRGFSFLPQEYKNKDYDTSEIFIIGESAGLMPYLLGALKFSGKNCLHVFISKVNDKKEKFLALFKDFPEIAGIYFYDEIIKIDDIKQEIDKVLDKKGKRKINVFYTNNLDVKFLSSVINSFSIANLSNLRKLNINHYFTFAKNYSYFLEREYKNIHYYGGFSDTGTKYLIRQSIGYHLNFDYLNATVSFDIEELKYKLSSPRLYWYAIDFTEQILLSVLFNFDNITYLGDDTTFTYFLHVLESNNYSRLKEYIMDEDFDFDTELHPWNKIHLTNEDNINLIENICYSSLPIGHYPKAFFDLYDNIKDKEIIDFDHMNHLIDKVGDTNDGDCFIFGNSDKIFPFVNAFLKTHKNSDLSLCINTKKYLDMSYYVTLSEKGYLSNLIKNPIEDTSMDAIFMHIDDFLSKNPDRQKTFFFIYDKMQLRMSAFILNYLKKKDFKNVHICSSDDDIFKYFDKEQSSHIFKFDYDELLYIKAVNKLADFAERNSISIIGSSPFADRVYKDLAIHTLAPLTYYSNKKDSALVSFDNAVVKNKWNIKDVKYDDAFIFSGSDVNQIIKDMEKIHDMYPYADLYFYNKYHSIMYFYKKFNSSDIIDKIKVLDEESLWIDFFLNSNKKSKGE